MKVAVEMSLTYYNGFSGGCQNDERTNIGEEEQEEHLFPNMIRRNKSTIMLQHEYERLSKNSFYGKSTTPGKMPKVVLFQSFMQFSN